MKRLNVHILIVAIAMLPGRVDASQIPVVTDVRAELARQQSAGERILIELVDETRVFGYVTRLDSHEFEIDGGTIAYRSVVAFLDPATGKPIARVQRSRAAQSGTWQPRQYSTRAVVIAAIAVAVVLIWIKLSVPYT